VGVDEHEEATAGKERGPSHLDAEPAHGIDRYLQLGVVDRLGPPEDELRVAVERGLRYIFNVGILLRQSDGKEQLQVRIVELGD
jgi:hypothetical protein